MKPAHPPLFLLLTCLIAFLVGAGAQPWLFPARPAPQAVDRNARPPNREKETAAARLADLATDPFDLPDEAELARVAGAVDLEHGGADRLNGVLQPELRSRLWERSIRAQIDQLPLEKLTAIACEARTEPDDAAFPAIFEKVHDTHAEAALAAGPQGKRLIAGYAIYWADRSSSFPEACACLPADSWGNGALRDRMALARLKGHPLLKELREMLALGPESWTCHDEAVREVWLANGDHAGIVAALEVLPVAERNTILHNLGHGRTAEEPDDFVLLLRSLTSYDLQHRMMEDWLFDHPQPEALLAEIRALPQPEPALEKITRELEAREASR